nr:SMI1/KNR4 family protein [Sinosporangium album]
MPLLSPGSDAATKASPCNPSPPHPSLRLPDISATRRVEAAWIRLERWLASNAPRTYSDLAPPAAPRELARFERSMGLRLPDDLKASLMRHNGVIQGSGSLFGMMYAPMSAQEIYDAWHALCENGEAEAGYPDANDTDIAPEAYWWHPSVIPFAQDTGGDHLVLDREGHVGEFFNDEGLIFADNAGHSSYVSLLERVAKSLESGRPLNLWRPIVTPNGVLEWAY